MMGEPDTEDIFRVDEWKEGRRGYPSRWSLDRS
jgi:hypothetical protein